MGASLSRCLESIAEGDRWAAEQALLAAQWQLRLSIDTGNVAAVLVPVVRPDGQASDLAVLMQPAHTVEQRVRAALDQRRQRGYRPDPGRPRRRGFIRALRFD